MNNLLIRISSGFSWMLISKLFLQFVKIFFMIFLARIILPSEFGKAAIIIIFFSICEGFFQFIYYNIIFLKKLTDKYISAAIYISIFISSFIIVVVYSLNYLLGYNDTDNLLGQVELFYICFVYFTGLCVVFKAVLYKNLYFKFIALSNSSANIIGTGVFSLFIALYFTQTYHAILLGFVLSYMLNLIFAIYKYKIKIKRIDIRHIKDLSSQFISITSNSIVNKFAINGDYIVINNYLGVNSLGFYSKAYEFVSKPVNIIGNTFNNVSLTSISNLKTDLNKVQQLVYKMTYLLSFISFPASVSIFLVGKDVIKFFLGPEWATTGEVISILGFLIFFRIGYKKLMALIQSKKQFNLILIIQLVYALNIIIGSYMLYPKGLYYISIWVVISCVLHYLICLFVVKREFSLNFVKILKEFIPGLMFSIILYINYLMIFDLIENIYISVFSSFLLSFLIFIILEKLYPGFIKIVKIKKYLINDV